MPYLFNDEEIKSVADLLTCLQTDEDRLPDALKPNRASRKRRSEEAHPTEEDYRKPAVWYRGLRDIGYSLVPTFYRPECRVKIADEIYLMNLFKQNSHELLEQIPSSIWEWMFLMRHHKTPSRLLDWTENPLVGLYFAVWPREDGSRPNCDSVLWCLLPNRINSVSLNWPINDSSLPMLSENPQEGSRGESEAIMNYLPTRAGELPTGRLPAAGIAPRTNRRMQVQMGVFTIHHANNRTPVEHAIADGTHIWRYTIPQEYKEPIYQELRRIGINKRTLFPDLDNVAAEAKDLLGGD